MVTHMRAFGLTPEQVLARWPAAERRPPASLAFSVLYGAIAFAIVSVLAYSIYAFRLIPGTGGMYAAIAVVYVALTGLALSGIVAGPGVASRFALLFAISFIAYAAVWCVFWFGLRGKHHAELWGSALGLAAMAWIIARAFGYRAGLLPLFGVLFAFHTLGFHGGEVLHDLVRGTPGKLLWGVGHGLGFGAGLGFVIAQCQAGLKAGLGEH